MLDNYEKWMESRERGGHSENEKREHRWAKLTSFIIFCDVCRQSQAAPMTRDLVKPHQPLHSVLSWLGRAATPQLKIHPGARSREWTTGCFSFYLPVLSSALLPFSSQRVAITILIFLHEQLDSLICVFAFIPLCDALRSRCRPET